MADDIVANSFVAARNGRIERFSIICLPSFGESADGRQNYVKRGGFKRLEKTLGKADREAVSNPAPFNPSAPHLQGPELRIFAKAKVRPKLRRGGVVIHIS